MPDGTALAEAFETRMRERGLEGPQADKLRVAFRTRLIERGLMEAGGPTSPDEDVVGSVARRAVGSIAEESQPRSFGPAADMAPDINAPDAVAVDRSGDMGGSVLPAFAAGAARGAVADAPSQLAGVGLAAMNAYRNPVKTLLHGAAALDVTNANPMGLTAWLRRTADAEPPVPPMMAGRIAQEALGRVKVAADAAGGAMDLIAPGKSMTPGSADSVFYSLGRSSPQMMASAMAATAGGFAGPVAAFVAPLIVNAPLQFGQDLEQNLQGIRQNFPGISDEDALALAFLPAATTAVASSALEAGFGPESVAGKLLAKHGVEQVARGWAERMLKSIGASTLEEAVTEPIQGTISDVGQVAAGGYTPELASGFLERRGQEALVGGMGGLLMGGPMAVGHAMGEESPRTNATPKVASATPNVATPEAVGPDPEEQALLDWLAAATAPPAPGPLAQAAVEAAQKQAEEAQAAQQAKPRPPTGVVITDEDRATYERLTGRPWNERQTPEPERAESPATSTKENTDVPEEGPRQEEAQGLLKTQQLSVGQSPPKTTDAQRVAVREVFEAKPGRYPSIESVDEDGAIVPAGSGLNSKDYDRLLQDASAKAKSGGAQPAENKTPAPAAGESDAISVAPNVRRIVNPNTAVMEVRDRNGNSLGVLEETHDGSMNGITRATRALQERAASDFGEEFSGIQSRTLADISGDLHVVSPNGLHAAPVGSDEAKYIAGDVSKSPKESSDQFAPVHTILNSTDGLKFDRVRRAIGVFNKIVGKDRAISDSGGNATKLEARLREAMGVASTPKSPSPVESPASPDAAPDSSGQIAAQGRVAASSPNPKPVAKMTRPQLVAEIKAAPVEVDGWREMDTKTLREAVGALRKQTASAEASPQPAGQSASGETPSTTRPGERTVREGDGEQQRGEAGTSGDGRAKEPWEVAKEAVRPYEASLRNLSDKELRAESKKADAAVTAWANKTPTLVGDSINPELRSQAGFEITERMHAVDREIERRKGERSEQAEKTKEPWEMTVGEWATSVRAGATKGKPYTTKRISEKEMQAHERLVRAAKERGETIPQEVQDQYPDLFPTSGATPVNNWRVSHDADTDPFRRANLLEAVASKPSTDKELTDVLDRLDEKNQGSAAWRVAYAVSVNPSASAAIKARAKAMYEQWTDADGEGAEKEGSISPERAATTERIIKAAARPKLRIVPIIELEGSDGKWRGPNGFPIGVEHTGNTRTSGYGYVDKYGVGVGKSFKTEQEAKKAQDDIAEENAAAFRKALNEMDDERFASQVDYWLKEKYEPKASTPTKPDQIEKDLDAIADLWAKESARINPDVPVQHKIVRSKVVPKIVEAATTGTFNDMLRPDNKVSRAVFEKITGTTLPKTLGGTKAQFTGTPFSIVRGAFAEAEAAETPKAADEFPGHKVHEDRTVPFSKDAPGAPRKFNRAKLSEAMQAAAIVSAKANGDPRYVVATNGGYSVVDDSGTIPLGQQFYRVTSDGQTVRGVRMERSGKMTATESPSSTPAQAVADHLVAGNKFATIVEARAFLSKLTGDKAASGTMDAKAVEETIEHGVVLAARKIIADMKGKPETDVYSRLVQLYGQQPNLSTRTGQSMLLQAYSTPVPLAYIVGRLAHTEDAGSVYEPTAGTGMLLIDADPARTTANELDPDRAKILKAQGFTTTEKDGAKTGPKEGSIDSVVGNPPFGTVPDPAGGNQKWPLGSKGRTDQIDQAIVQRALASMKKDGRAAFVVGSKREMATGEPAYKGRSRLFYRWLYAHYNVTHHFTVSGDLYTKQGAGFPVDVFVIEGEGRSSLPLPAETPPKVYDSWATLGKEVLNEDRSTGNIPAESNTGNGGGAAGPENPDAGNVSSPAARPDQNDDGGGKPAVGVRSPTSPGAKPRGGASATKPGSDSGRGSVSTDAGADRVGVPGDGGAKPERAGNQSVQEGQPGGLGTGGVRGDSGVAASSENEETATQTAYKPLASDARSVGTVLPRNHAEPLAAAFGDLKDEVGEPTAFVAKELGWSDKHVRERLSAEQIDATALAINQAKREGGMVIGDQTGVGKGRVVATIMQWAAKNKMLPVFVTQDAKLYGDMLRDLEDTGSPDAKLLPTNSDLRGGKAIAIDSGNAVRSVANVLDVARAMQADILAGKTPDYLALATTYSQLTGSASGPRRRAMLDLADSMFLIMDESHNAGGTDMDSRERLRQNGLELNKQNRSFFFRSLLGRVRSAMYSSATWAKRPTVMDLYSKTDLRYAVDDIAELGTAIKRGGVALQQVISTELVRLGQYIRRERSFKGVEYVTDTVKSSREEVGSITETYADISRIDGLIKPAVEAYIETLGDAEQDTDDSVGTGGVESTNFTSQLHNAISQMNLSAKTNAAADYIIERLKAGEKVVVALENTMESLIAESRDAEGARTGAPAEVSFKSRLMRYLNRSLQVRISEPNDDGGFDIRTEDVPEEFWSDELKAEVARVRAKINALQLDNMPVSPIDWLMHRLKSAGVKVGEITGREEILAYQSDGSAIYDKRHPAQRNQSAQRRTIAAFQNGDLDVVILNASGATGISLHADAHRAKDKKPRRMVILQPIRNIDVFMQALGRVHRTGQVVKPRYTMLVSDIPSEKRPGALLSKKMASLNANVSSARGGDVTFDAPDLFNTVGDSVVEKWMESPDGAAVIGQIYRPDEAVPGINESDPGLLAQKITGRMSLLPLDTQEEVWNTLGEMFKDSLAMLTATGENPLEVNVRDLRAKTINTLPWLEPRVGPRSWFTSASTLEKVEAKLDTKPLTAQQLIDEAQELLGKETWDAITEKRVEAARAYVNRKAAGYKDRDAGARYKDEAQQDIEEFRLLMLGRARPGTFWVHPQLGNIFIRRVLERDTTQNPMARSRFAAEVVFADERRPAHVSLGDLANSGYDANDSVKEEFDTFAADPVMRRWVAKGNLLQAWEKLGESGESTDGLYTLTYTNEDGAESTGIVFPRSWGDDWFEKQSQGRANVMRDSERAGDLLRENDYLEVVDTSKTLVLRKRDGKFEAALPPDRRSSVRFLAMRGAARAAGSDFVRRKGEQVMDIPESKLDDTVRAFTKAGVGFVMQSGVHADQNAAVGADNKYRAAAAELAEAEKKYGTRPKAPEGPTSTPGDASSPSRSPKSVASRLLDWADSTEQDAREKLRSGLRRRGPRIPGSRIGATTGPSDIVQAARIVVAKVIRSGVKTAEAVKKAVFEVMAEFGPAMEGKMQEVGTLVRRSMVRIRSDAEATPETIQAAIEQVMGDDAAQARPPQVASPADSAAAQSANAESKAKLGKQRSLYNAGLMVAGRMIVAKQAKKGGKVGAKGMEVIVNDVVAQSPWLKGQESSIKRIARGFLRDAGALSKPKAGDIEPGSKGYVAKMHERLSQAHQAATDELARHREAQRADRAARAASAKAGGQLPATKMVSEREALKGRIKGEAATAAKITSAAAKATKAALGQQQRTIMADTQRWLSDSVRDLFKARKRERQIGKIEARAAVEGAVGAEKAKESVAQGMRKHLIALLEEHLPPRLRSKYLNAVRSTKTPAALATQMNRLRRDMIRYDARQNIERAASASKAGIDTLEPELQADVRAASAAIEYARRVIWPRAVQAKAMRASNEALSLARDQIREASNLIVSAFHQQKTMDDIRVGGEAIDAATMREQIVNHQKSRPDLGAVSTTGNREVSGLTRIMRRRSGWRQLSILIDGPAGAAMRLYRDVLRGRRLAAKMHQQFADKFGAIVQANGFKDLGAFLARVSGSLGPAGQEWLDVKFGPHKRITLGQALYIYASSTDEGFRARVLPTRDNMGFVKKPGQTVQFRESDNEQPFNIDEKDLDRVEAAIPENLRRIVDQGKALYDATFFEQLSKVNKRLKGYFLDKVTGYFGIKLIRKAGPDRGTPSNWKGSMVRALEEAGFMQERTGASLAPVAIGDFGSDILLRSKAAAHTIHKAERVKALVRTLLHADPQNQGQNVVTALTKTLGAETIKRLETRIAAWSEGDAGMQMDKGFRRILSLWARSKTQLWPGTWLRNAFGAAKLLNEMSPTDILYGLSGITPAAYADLRKHSPELRERWDGGGLGAFQTDTAAQVGRAGFFDAGKMTLRNLGMLALKESSRKATRSQLLRGAGRAWNATLDSMSIGNYFDAVSAMVAYRAFQRKAPKNLDADAKKEWAARQATEVFERVANTSSTEHANDIQLAARESVMLASFIPFTGDVAKSQAMMYEAVQRGPKAFVRTATTIAISAAMSGLATAIIAALRGDPTDDEKKKGPLYEAAMRFIGDASSIVPGGAMSMNVVRAIGMDSPGANVLDTPFTDMIGDLIRVGADLRRGFARLGNKEKKRVLTSAELFTRALWRSSDLAGDVTGLPISQIRNFIRKARENWGGDED